MSAYKGLLTLEWLKGEDGRISFTKLVGVCLQVMLGVLLWHLVDSPNLSDALWPIVALFGLCYAGSFGLKGLQLYFSAVKITGKDSFSRQVIERRDPDEGIDPA